MVENWEVITGYLRDLSAMERHRVLTTPMRPNAYTKLGACGPCLVGTAAGVADLNFFEMPIGDLIAQHRTEHRVEMVEHAYDVLCDLLGVETTNRCIQEEIRAMEIGEIERIVKVEPEPFALPAEAPIEPARVEPAVPVEEPELVPA